MPKGVMLSHYNILSDFDGLAQIFWVTRKDRLIGVLPFSDSLGFTGTLWLPLLSGFGVVYHPNSMDTKVVGDMVSRYKATILLGTPTSYAAYLRGCSVEEFSSLRIALTCAEMLDEHLAKAFKEKYGLNLLEGYGCTEMAPVISVNIPDFRQEDQRQAGFKPRSVGHPIPGVAVKVVDSDTGETLPYGKEGLLLVKGPSRMIGYLGWLERTEEVLREGWYITGDTAFIDKDGFIKITDYPLRFSKNG